MHNSQACVSNLTVSNAVIRESDNGLRIKTWQGGTGSVTGLRFENIQMENVLNCIIIDQYYCLSKECLNQTSAVHVNEVTYRNIKGTYDVRTPPIHFACSDAIACTNLTLSEVELLPHEGQLLDDPFCWNAYGIQETPTIPPINCLRDGDPATLGEISQYECRWLKNNYRWPLLFAFVKHVWFVLPKAYLGRSNVGLSKRWTCWL